MASKAELREAGIELEKTGKAEYAIIVDGKVIGWLYKEHESGNGHRLAKYAGAIRPHDYWQIDPNDDVKSPLRYKSYDSFKESKSALLAFLA